MDIKTLVVGQEVWMQSGIYAKKAKVFKITDRHVEVELLRAEGPVGLKYGIRFDRNSGVACDSSDIYEGNMFGFTPGRIPGTHEFGPWELDDATFEERLRFVLESYRTENASTTKGAFTAVSGFLATKRSFLLALIAMFLFVHAANRWLALTPIVGWGLGCVALWLLSRGI